MSRLLKIASIDGAIAGAAGSAKNVAPAGTKVIRPGTDIKADVDALEAALRPDQGLYQRDGDLVRVTRTTETHNAVWKPGTPRIGRIPLANLIERAATFAKWEKWDGRRNGGDGAWVPALPPKHVVVGFEARGEWASVRPLVAVAECPFMRPDGTICATNGYDPMTGVLLESDLELEPIPDAPTQKDARAAWAVVKEPFDEFPVRGLADLSAAISAALTMIARPAIRGAIPAVIIDKNSPGTGGTLVTDLIAIITTGRTAPRLSWPTNPDELEKLFGALALGGANQAPFDNISTPFCGAPLDKVLTCEDKVQLRVLGLSEAPTVHWRAQIMGSGNNILIAGDTIPRCLVARFETTDENPRERSGFRIPDLRSWTRAHRAKLVRAALVILRAYVVAGRPKLSREWGSFESYAALIPPAIVFAGGADPQDCRLRADSAGDPEIGAVVVLLNRLPELCAHGTTVRQLVALLYPPERVRGERCGPDEWDDLRGALEALAPLRGGRAVDPHRLGNALRPYKGRVLGGLRLVSDDGKNSQRVARWTVEAVTPPRTASTERTVSSYAGEIAGQVVAHGLKDSSGSSQSSCPEAVWP